MGSAGRVAKLLLLALLAASASGCVGILARWIAVAPNAGASFRPEDDPLPPIALDGGSAQRVEIESPPASLFAWIVRPKGGAPPRGTIFCLHGIRADRSQLAGHAQAFTEDGYAAVLLDLRGHGRSTGDWLTYGIVESRDISRVIDVLQERGLVAGPYGVFGFSYGAAVAIQCAARDRRIAAAVAVGSFSALRTVIMDYADRYSLGFLIPDSAVIEATEEAGKLGEFDPDQVSPVQAIARCDIPVLLIHGGADGQIALRHSEAIRDAAAGRAALFAVEGEGHLSVLKSAVLYEASKAFFRRNLGRR